MKNICEVRPGQVVPTDTETKSGNSKEDSSRRKFLQKAMGGTVAGMVTAAGMEFVSSGSLPHKAG